MNASSPPPISSARGGAGREARCRAAHAAGESILFHRVRYDSNRPKYAGSGSTDVWSLNTATGAFTLSELELAR